MPHRIACVTDLVASFQSEIEVIAPPGDFEDIHIPTWAADRPQCFRRLAMFRPEPIFGHRFACMDMDCVIAGALDPLFDRPEDIVLYRTPRSAINTTRPYCGAMLLMTAGARPQVFTEFTPARAEAAGRRYPGSDQAWISNCLGPGEATWSEADGVLWWGDWRPDVDARITFHPGDQKPWHIGHPWVSQRYTAHRGGRCLILGHSPTVWRDAGAAIGRFGCVIASPEAARHVRADMIARDDHEAEQMARIMGFDDVLFCGRSGKA